MTHIAQLSTQNLHVDTPLGRALFDGLNLTLNDGDKVAIVGRNGTGKSTLLRVLLGDINPSKGHVACTGSRVFVPQLNEDNVGSSPGEHRRQLLEHAFERAPNFLLLDEPSLDLDQASTDWLIGALRRHQGACIMVSHDRRLLRLFSDFFVVSESGCHHHHGSFDSLLAALSEQQQRHEQKYVRQVSHHEAQEAEHVRIARGRERKKNLGRVRELKRCPAKIALNSKRGYAQVSQSRRAALQDKRLGAARDWVKAVRRSLAVQLPLEVTLQQLPAETSQPIVDARALTVGLPNGRVTQPLDLCLSRERVALSGPNGCGKSTLINVLLGDQPKSNGTLHTALHKVGYIAQNATNWQRPECLLEQLCFGSEDLERAAAVVSAHRFPVSLAQRPLVSLSPGERVRAALLALCERTPQVELLVLDEPTNHLDLLAIHELERILRAWPGGLLVVSHDREFLSNIGISRELCHTGHGWRDSAA